MDFIRASLKALFYDFPVETVVQIITTGSATLSGEMTKLVNARERCYTQASMEALRKELQGEWMGTSSSCSGKDELVKAFQVPYLYAQATLDETVTVVPLVNYEDLFRWSELTRYVGEELLTVNYLAKKDIENRIIRHSFTWDCVLPHNNAELNTALRKNGQGWTDIHMHFAASSGVFVMNWVSLMNNIQGKKDVFSKLTHPLDSPVISGKHYDYDDLYRWCVLAANIRWELYKYYIKGDAGAFNKAFEDEFLKLAYQRPMFFRYELRNLQCLINKEGDKSLKTADDKVFDYAIAATTVSPTDIHSPFMIYHGERYLLYQFYHDYWTKNKKNRSRYIAPYVYLYELIKNQLRRELLQMNDLPGLGNFKEYNARKALLVEKDYNLSAYKFAVQTTILQPNDGMEVRIMPQADATKYREILESKYHEYIFGDGQFTTEKSLSDRMTFVVHFSKMKCKGDNRYAKLRETVREQAEVLMEDVYKVEEKRGIRHRIVGIDAAGGETNCRPEVFAHLYRYCRVCGMKHYTYHVGEDFYDITEGLRSIEEAVRFLQLGQGDRLGHCMALGIDAKKYYSQRHQVVIMPKQLLLDNLIWLMVTAEEFGIGMPKHIRETIEVKIADLYTGIGYKQPFSVSSYYNSMLLRGNDMEKYENSKSEWLRTAKDDSNTALDAAKDPVARKLCCEYFADKEIYKDGFLQVDDFKIPYLYDRLIKKVQNKMIRWIRDVKKISIETNPTSNLRTGRLEKYDALHIYRLSKVRNMPHRNVIVSVNTDDKGIFGTSLHREFSLLALALTKQKVKGRAQKWDKNLVYDYVGRLTQAGPQNRFI